MHPGMPMCNMGVFLQYRMEQFWLNVASESTNEWWKSLGGHWSQVAETRFHWFINDIFTTGSSVCTVSLPTMWTEGAGYFSARWLVAARTAVGTGCRVAVHLALYKSPPTLDKGPDLHAWTWCTWKVRRKFCRVIFLFVNVFALCWHYAT